MEEIVKLVAKKAGLNESVAQIAVTATLSAVKAKLPANVSGILDSFLSTNTKTAKSNDMLGGVIGGLGNLLGKK